MTRPLEIQVEDRLWPVARAVRGQPRATRGFRVQGGSPPDRWRALVLEFRVAGAEPGAATPERWRDAAVVTVGSPEQRWVGSTADVVRTGRHPGAPLSVHVTCTPEGRAADEVSGHTGVRVLLSDLPAAAGCWLRVCIDDSESHGRSPWVRVDRWARDRALGLLPPMLQEDGGTTPGATELLVDLMGAFLLPVEGALDALPASWRPLEADANRRRALAGWLMTSRVAPHVADEPTLLEHARARGPGVCGVSELAERLNRVFGAGSVRAEHVPGRPFHARFAVAPHVRTRLAVLHAMVQAERPAHMTYEVVELPRPPSSAAGGESGG